MIKHQKMLQELLSFHVLSLKHSRQHFNFIDNRERNFLICFCHFFLVDVDNVYENPEDEIKHARPSPSTLTSRKKGKHVSSWTINEEFTFRITAICRLNCDVNRSVEVGNVS
jgi:hypothetical protein